MKHSVRDLCSPAYANVLVHEHDGPKLEISRMLTVSSSHVTVEDGRLMLLGKWPARCQAIGGAGTIFVVDDGDPNIAAGYSPHFGDLLTLAQKNGCDFLRIDTDGPVVPGLPTFDW